MSKKHCYKCEYAELIPTKSRFMPYECRCTKCGLLVVNPAGACSEFKSAVSKPEVSSNGGYQDDSK